MQNEGSSRTRLRVVVLGPHLLRSALASIVSEGFDVSDIAETERKGAGRPHDDEAEVCLALAGGSRDLTRMLDERPRRCIVLVVLIPPEAPGDRASVDLLRLAGSAGIQSFVGTEDPPGEIRHAVRAAWSGEAFCSPSLVPCLVRALHPPLTPPLPSRMPAAAAVPLAAPPPAAVSWGLTERESEVAALAARGLSNEEIGTHLFLGVNTVKSHLKQIFRKGRLTRRSQLAHRWADTAPPVSLVYSRGTRGGASPPHPFG